MGGFATKYNVSKSLVKHHMLAHNVPETKMFRKSVLKKMLDQYEMVYVKPNDGTGGKGVMRVEKLEQDSYEYQLKTAAKTFSSFESMYQSLCQNTKKSPFVIQRGIHLLKYSGRRFDLRVMVQKNPKGKWETTGVIGRLGHPKKIVTNVCKGGSSKPVELLLKKHVPSVVKYTKKLERLGFRAAVQLNKTFPRIKELGFDVAIDSELHPWILEANPRPVIYGFKTLKDKRIYRKINRYQKAYGRR
ncbi:YheC/YheD family protein [Paenibacillus hodogayensis]|uniref:YheC/YheD family protein n=1 Tax=Paenibacillus hodogayensis TaxID=279208 RepID=A0ABV5VUC9_9BACL